LRLALGWAIQGEKVKGREAAQRAQALQRPFDDPWMYRESYPEWLASAYDILGEHRKAIGMLPAFPSGMADGLESPPGSRL
jgi:hypothetical protein